MDNKSFTLNDLRGDELKIGDCVVLPRTGSRGYGPYLCLGIIKKIKYCSKVARVYVSLIDDNYLRHSYIDFPYASSGSASNQFIKIDNIEWSINQKSFAKLLEQKTEFDSSIIPQEGGNK